VGPGEARPVVVIPQDPFLLADGGVLQSPPPPSPAPALCFAVVCAMPVSLPKPEREDASDTALSSVSSLGCIDDAGLHNHSDPLS